MPLSLAPTMATRFPLVARKRPPAKPLDARVARLAGLAEAAHREHEPEKASMVFNGAALVASDCADAKLAELWCHRHANLYLDRAPLNGYTARFALEPVVNLARLHIRAGDGERAYLLLTGLHDAVINSAPIVIGRLEIQPRQLPEEAEERQQISNWLRNVLLADGTRALTVTGQWTDALAHVQRFDGIGAALHDGRQVAVVAHLVGSNISAATAVLDRTTIEQPWEELVRDLLYIWSAAIAGDRSRADHLELIGRASKLAPGSGLSVFRTRLILTALDLAPNLPTTAAAGPIDRLAAEVIQEQDAKAARDLLNHPAVDPENHRILRQMISASGLGIGQLPKTAHRTLSSALNLAETVIRNNQANR
ncbi:MULTISPECIES: hypothetical protein [unclassified Micromonospora]|uniref:hypothetical protein n=1 Tax=unclassified Micromonospora TaxID=2617518 RepID=UPI001C21FD69|nr:MULTISPECIES: hypothetical protein [unclassified Micromonospora]MBU8857699.1 hypothetical protein [Micromonospora sp. WMMB482]MDM4783326.1 hypothetical protein [Micromonospora sp. b486]